VNARSALFDLFGDHLRSRGGRAPVAALVRLLAPMGVAPPAVRTAVSRMVRQGWLAPVRLVDGPGYVLTPRAVRRLDDAATRIYRTRLEDWDGAWHLLVTDLPGERARRDRLRAGLTFLGYAQLDDATWIGPRWSEEVDLLLETESVRAERFLARHDGDSIGLVRRAWDIEGLSRAYLRWLADAEKVVADAVDDSSDEQAFAARSRLVHEWRKFLFLDPGLPRELLPPRWAGDEAARFFDAESGRLQPAATRFVERCLTNSGTSGTGGPST
jgi:phenylacetic acid degradation operon negative regulatory protein